MMLGMMVFMPGICLAEVEAQAVTSTQAKADSTILNKIWSYAKHLDVNLKGKEQNVYMSYSFMTKRRNFTLWLIPTLYSIAKGDRNYFSESYCRMKFIDDEEFEMKRQVVCGTIPSYRNVMPTLMELVAPRIYDVSIYPDQILSPFNKSNRHFYSYQTYFTDTHQCIVQFSPRTDNTQLIKGHAVVNTDDGYIHAAIFEGTYDMFSYKVTLLMNDDKKDDVLPSRCTSDASFYFLGNRINASFSTYYNCPTTLPDSLNECHDRDLMDKLRPVSLTNIEQEIYNHSDLKQQENQDSTKTRRKSKFSDFMWNVLGDNLVNSLQANTKGATVSISPLFNPLYFGYSQSQGLSYKLNIGAQYFWNSKRYLTFNPSLGYNFKKKQFYFTAPLRMTYNPKRNGYAELTWANGNRTNNGALVEDLQERAGEDVEIPEFKDEFVQVVNNVVAFDWLEIKTGLEYHRRSSTNKALMREVGMDDVYKSFAPLLEVQLNPWQKGPMLTIHYEHGFQNVLQSDLRFDRWEFDACYKRPMRSLRAFNIRLGTGFYTSRNSDYFVDYTNFREYNLPSGWDDDWTGQFQLLDSRWYNESNYYLRGNFSYESPLLALTWLPIIGRMLKTERVYLSALSIEHTRPYFELGYGFTNRFFTTGFFVSFLNTKFQRFGCRFTLELFRDW